MVIRSAPAEPKKQEYRDNASVGGIIKAHDDATRLARDRGSKTLVPITLRKDERTGRHRYVKGFKVGNKNCGGRFVKDSDAADILRILKINTHK